MRLVDRYVYDVTHRLPEKQRSDVARELTAEIEEMCKARATGKKVTRQHQYDVLMELGSPSSLADSYRERPRYLIGPDYYEPYTSLLRILFAVIVPLLVFLTWMTEAVNTHHSGVSMSIKLLGVALESSMHIFFWTTISFWFVQTVADGQPHDRDWKPEDLPNLPPEQEITRGESFFAIAWTVFAMLATLFQVPAIYQAIGPDTTPQFFSAEMWPAWTLGLLGVSILGLVVELAKLYVGGWTKLTVGLITVVNLVTIAFFVAVVTRVNPIANPDMTRLIAESVGKPDIAGAIERGIDIFVIIVVVVCVCEIAEAVYKYKKGGKQ